MAKLILRSESGQEEEFPLDNLDTATIGRSPDCEVTISDGQASRRHCSVVRLKSGWEVQDLGSTNGTLLNSVLVKKKTLKHGDVIRIGGTELTLDDPTAAGPDVEAGACSLVYAKGDRKGDKIELHAQRTTIGRKDSNTIVMADDANVSSYHCEIVRSLNGYTIRDLGSTNGTLVNNEMITESPLAHGARIRVGSTRFVFQDPAMAEVDLELAGVDDDEADWGMMRELDLAAVRKRNPATLVYGVLFLAIIGGLVYFTQFVEPGQKVKGVRGPEGNKLDDTYSFESPSDAFLWESDPRGLTLETTDKVKASGKLSLRMRSPSGPADIYYEERIPARAKRAKLTGKLGASGTTARLALYWTGGGLSRWETSEPVSGGLKEVSIEGGAPPWATRLTAAVRIEGAGTAHLDDVVLTVGGSNGARTVEQNNFQFVIVDGQDVELSHTGAPILVNGHVVADGAPVRDASVKAEVVDEEHILVTVSGAGEGQVGIRFQEQGGYLSRGGFRGFGYKPDSTETYFTRNFPPEGNRTDERVRKLLLGNPGRALAVLPATDEQRLRSEALNEGRERFWVVSGEATGGTFSFRLKTNLRGETAEAARRMSAALALHNDGKWGEFMREAERALAEFPFASKTTQRRLSDRIAEVTREYVALAKEAATMLADYEEFRDLQSLDRVREILHVWRTRFQVKAGEGQRGKEYETVARREAELRNAALSKAQSRRAAGFFEQAKYLHMASGEDYSAAVMFTYIAEWLPFAEQVEEARTELDTISKQKPQVLKVLKALGLRR